MEATERRSAESTGIEQPTIGEQAGLTDDLHYVGLGRRAVAIILDSVLLMSAYFVLGFLIGATTGGQTAGGFSLTGGPAFLLFGLTLIIGLGYFIYFEGVRGSTPGKQLVGLKVVMADGTPCTTAAATVRTVLRIVDGFFFYLVGALFVATSGTKQRLGDRIADTVVVRR